MKLLSILRHHYGTRVMIRGIIKREREGEHGNSLVKMAVAFIAGMVITAVLAQTPVVANQLSSQFSDKSVIPALPDAPDPVRANSSYDTTHPVKSRMNELVWTSAEEVVSTLNQAQPYLA